MSGHHPDNTSEKINWAFHNKQWETSKLSQSDYCKQANISYATID